MNTLPRSAQLYIVFIILLAIGFTVVLGTHYPINNYGTLLLFMFLSFFVESMAVPLPNNSAVSVGYAVSLSTMVILGPLGSALCCGVGVMFRVFKVSKNQFSHIGNTPFYKTLFNGASGILSIGIPSVVYYSFGTEIGDPNFYTKVIPLLAALFTYLIINISIVTALFSILTSQSFWGMFVDNFKWTLPNSFVIATLGIFIGLMYLNYGSIIMLLFFGPLLLARYSFKLYIDMRNLYMETVYALTKAVEAKDPYTNGHSQRVSVFAEELAHHMGLESKQISDIKTAALLHDIGKIGIEDHILNKPSRLTDEEMVKIKNHPAIGINILNDVYFLNDIKTIIYQHHERFDGNGYPCGIGGSDVQLESYILSIADAYDAMTSDRSYRKGMATEEALSIISKESGKQFHPDVAESFIQVQNKNQNKLATN